jgi:hypothetical protein
MTAAVQCIILERAEALARLKGKGIVCRVHVSIGLEQHRRKKEGERRPT